MKRFSRMCVTRQVGWRWIRSAIRFDAVCQCRSNLQLVAVMTLLCAFTVNEAAALDTLDGLLPTPHLLRSRAADLDIDESTQARIEKMYKAAEPEYHELTSELYEWTVNLETLLLKDDHFNNHFEGETITRHMKGLLDTENRLKLYQVRVRVQLLSQVTAEQRQRARNYASEKLESARWRGDVRSDGKLDNQLPKPFWLRSRASELGIDDATRKRLEQTYQSMEPRYHELKQTLKPLTQQLSEVLLADTLDAKSIVKRFNALLAAEQELKLYQVLVRTTLLSHVSPRQRREAQKLVMSSPEADWRKVLSEKAQRVRTLSAQISSRGESIVDVSQRLFSAQGLVAAGRAMEAGRKLDQVIRDLQGILEGNTQNRTTKDDALDCE